MRKISTEKFFQEVNRTSTEITGTDSEISEATKSAVEMPSPLTFVKAQEALAQVPDDIREQILKQVHLRMSTDVGAIWDQLPYATAADRTN